MIVSLPFFEKSFRDGRTGCQESDGMPVLKNTEVITHISFVVHDTQIVVRNSESVYPGSRKFFEVVV